MPMTTPHNKKPWKHVALDGGWDGIADADGHVLFYDHVLFKMSENNPVNATHLVQCVNSHEALVEALKKVLHQLIAIEARDGAPQYIAWDRGRPMQNDSCTHEYWSSLVDECQAALALAEGKTS